MTFLKNVFAAIAKFLGPVIGAIQGTVIPSEFVRILIMAFAAGGGLLGALQALQSELSKWWSDPETITIASSALAFLIALVAEWARRNQHGPPLQEVAIQIAAQAVAPPASSINVDVGQAIQDAKAVEDAKAKNEAVLKANLSAVEIQGKVLLPEDQAKSQF
ncbi:MAG: hypothetical protein AB7G11_02570 [Phycisphaerales bacterium]